jgi:hypothetical protein
MWFVAVLNLIRPSGFSALRMDEHSVEWNIIAKGGSLIPPVLSPSHSHIQDPNLIEMFLRPCSVSIPSFVPV